MQIIIYSIALFKERIIIYFNNFYYPFNSEGSELAEEDDGLVPFFWFRIGAELRRESECTFSEGLLAEEVLTTDAFDDKPVTDCSVVGGGMP